MRTLLSAIALRHLLTRRRQSLVSTMGIVLGVAFFLAIASLMQGSETDFITRLVDSAPHITIADEFRNPHPQPAELMYPAGAVEIRNVRPATETRGLRGYERILEIVRAIPGARASPVLTGQALVSAAGRDVSVTLNGMIPEEIRDVSTISDDMVEGGIDALGANVDGIVIGTELADKLSLGMGQNVTLSTPNGQVHAFTVVGLFRTGRTDYDASQAFVNLKRVQALLDRANRVNTIIVKLSDPYTARALATEIEADVGYKSVSWQEATEDLMSTLTIRNIIMYTVVSAVLVVAAFGIYNVISTVVMEKRRDIAILKSIGFHAGDIQRIFLLEGGMLGLGGSVFGIALGAALMYALGRVTLAVPGSSDPITLPLDWSWVLFAIAASFAMGAALVAAVLPARKGARVDPAQILRGL
jgi:lipoprotein-releasing system permease protein